MSFTILETMTAEPVSDRATAHTVRTRDGVDLATDVYLPEGSAPRDTFPTIMVRTPYDKSSRYTGISHEAAYFTARGYAYVAQDVRGKFRSSGKTDPYTFDVADGYDTVDWIVRQSWSDGAVGVVGASYYGFTAWATVASGHPAIKAAIPQVTGIEMGASHVASRWNQEVPAFAAMNDILQIWTDNQGYLAEIDWRPGSVERIIAKARGEIGESSAARKLLERSRDESWYNPYGDRHPHQTTAIPILHWQNWYDPGLAPLGLRDWRHFRALPGLRELHYLRVGSADHGGYLLDDVGRGDAANPYLDDHALAAKIEQECGEMADFFDEHVRGIARTRERPHARWHHGHVGWQEGAEYPPPSVAQQLHLTPEGSLDPSESAASSSRSWVHDPSKPVPSGTDMEGLWYLLAAYPDERGLAERDDVLTFRTGELDAPLDFAGHPVLEAEVEFDGRSSHLFAKLQDVFPDGTTRPISWGRMVLHRRQGSRVRLELDDNAYRVQAGHRLQVQIASSDYPYFLVHPGTDDNPWLAPTLRTVEHRITLGGEHGARLTLPTVRVG
jgi:putative CocE/NonD family hydrolase